MFGIPVASKSSKRKEPEVVVFDDSVLKKAIPSTSKMRNSGFMASKISKINKKKKVTKKTEEELKQEEDDKDRDRELELLLNSSKIIESVSASQLTGKERHKYNQEQLTKLGLKSAKQEHAPRNIRYEKRKYKEGLVSKAIQEANRGLLTDNVKMEIKNNLLGTKKPKQKRELRGLKASIGRYRSGAITLTQSEIDRVNKSNAPSRTFNFKPNKRRRK
ncbi:hypothetical protein H4219_003189 [Mycoemilia scoparia]|uniref:Uncharacterized protein n=1 Tax=Mycoemilia scoparia TaxID=417184 RepID=A0A9W7ZVI2_9FUNG|nr:hypothetical protein H4219_003189 [Mycoemilia scoparia]